ncbi:MAG: class I SAM-dependent RNA methyltransferase [Anaerolineaceae bacterium]|nr:class I SAM-dependent RNA methyltransferase [Anaerolineaceae bacterium]
MSYQLFAVTVPGLEPFTQAELAGLGIKSRLPKVHHTEGEPREEAGGVEFEASLSDLYCANLHLRSANRILVRLGEFYAAAFSELRTKASRLPWELYLKPGQPVTLRVTCHKSRLYHSDAVAERVAGAISDHLGKSVPIVKPGTAGEHIKRDMMPRLVIVRLVHDQCTISLDTSGELLHRRGYRLETAKAPLRETLAAGLLLGAGWDAVSPIIDPFCGSGTIPIEAALMARRIAPGKNRHFAFMDWPGFDSKLWQTIYAQALANEQPGAGVIQASDRDAGAIRIAQANAERANVLADIQFSCRTFSAIEAPPGIGWIVTNPPYGVRVSPSHDLRDLYTHLGDVLRSLCPGWHAGVLCASDYLAGHTHLPFDQALPLVNGGIPVKFFMGKVT